MLWSVLGGERDHRAHAVSRRQRVKSELPLGKQAQEGVAGVRDSEPAC